MHIQIILNILDDKTYAEPVFQFLSWDGELSLQSIHTHERARNHYKDFDIQLYEEESILDIKEDLGFLMIPCIAKTYKKGRERKRGREGEGEENEDGLMIHLRIMVCL